MKGAGGIERVLEIRGDKQISVTENELLSASFQMTKHIVL